MRFSVIICSKCGKKVAEDAVFCSSCGEKIKEKATPKIDEVIESSSEEINENESAVQHDYSGEITFFEVTGVRRLATYEE